MYSNKLIVKNRCAIRFLSFLNKSSILSASRCDIIIASLIVVDDDDDVEDFLDLERLTIVFEVLTSFNCLSLSFE